MRRAWLLLCVALPGAAWAQDAQLHGLVDARIVAAPEEPGWTRGGLGKSRYGAGDDGLRFGGAALEGRWQALPELLLFADLQFHADDRNTMEAVEAYARWRPVSTSAWRTAFKLGEFFPAVSLENEGVGWSSLWTLTPSAINSWVGEELRSFGGEARLEYRGEQHSFEAAATLFEGSDPAGELIASRGWSLSDLTLGLGSRTREPDEPGYSNPRRYNGFQEFDHRPGWIGELTWRAKGWGRVTALRYDNKAESRLHSEGAEAVYGWRTYFWSLAAETRLDPVTLVAQAMDGNTEIAAFDSQTAFSSAFLLAAWDRGAWRPALRVEAFSTRSDPPSPESEHGNAVTAALNWRPRDWLRLTAEVLRIDSVREQRLELFEPARSVAVQVQLGARLLF